MRQKRSVIAYSFLAQTTRGDGDLLQGLTPIFKPIAKSHANEKFDPEGFSKLLNDLYGIKVHNWAIEDLLPRLEAAGIVYKAKISDDLEQYFYSEIDAEFDAVNEKDISSITQSFVNFATPILKSHNLPVDEEMLEDAFLTQLVDMDFISILLKPDRSKDDSKSPHTLSLKKPQDQVTWEEDVAAKSKVDVLSASFILEIYKTNSTLYDLVMRVATGALLSEVILNIQDPEVNISLAGLSVILDTPFLMSLLDLSCKESHGFAKEICQQLRDKGAKIATFEHSVQELQDNLKAVINRSKRGQGSGHTSIRLRDKSFEAFAKNVLSNTDLVLSQFDVGLIKNPTSPHIYQFFTEDDQKSLESSLGFYNYPLARERDAQSIASVVRLRRGSSYPMRKLPQCGFIFVAQNTSLVDKASEFCKREKIYSDKDIPPALSEKYLSGLLWVIYGGKGNDLTRHLLLANCAAALEPRNDIISKMHGFLSNSSDHQLELFDSLMTNERAGQYAMQASLGDSSLITEKNFPEILEKIKTALIESHEIESDKKMKEINNVFDEKINEKEREFSQSLTDKDARIDSLNEVVDKEKQKSIHLQKDLEENKAKVNTLVQSLNESKLERENLVKSQVKRILEDTRAYKRTLKIRFSLGLALMVAIVSMVLSLYDFSVFLNFLLFLLTSSLLAWYVPEHLFGGYINKKSKKYFYLEIEKVLISKSELITINVDWQSLELIS